MAGDAVTLSVPGPHGDREVRISSPTRVIWPEPGITKLELAEYLVTVGDAFIEANGDRPVSLQRFPGGIDGEQFFSKNPPKGAPEWVRSVTVTYPSGRRHPQLVLDEPAAAVWAAQMNTIVFHPWASSAGNTDNPDQLRIDLDPQPGTGFAEAVPAALALRDAHGRGGAHGVREDVGQPRHPRVRAHRARARVPRRAARGDRRSRASWSGACPMSSPPHGGRRNAATASSSTTTRPTATARWRAPTAPGRFRTRRSRRPLEWDELEGADPAAFTIRTVPDRLREHGDPWAGMQSRPGRIGMLLDWWQRDLDAGLGELPFPPDFPKMPGEPMRVQPSRARNPE